MLNNGFKASGQHLKATKTNDKRATVLLLISKLEGAKKMKIHLNQYHSEFCNFQSILLLLSLKLSAEDISWKSGVLANVSYYL